MLIDVAKRVVRRKLQAGLAVLLVSAPGVGKSQLTFEIAREDGYDVVLSHPVVEDPSDVKGVPFPNADGKTACFLPYGILAKVMAATTPTLWFIDDLGQAHEDVQAAYMQLLLGRQIGGHKIPDCVRFIAATNRKQDRAGVAGILEPVKSRFVSIINIEPSRDAWVNWAIGAKKEPIVIAYVNNMKNDDHFFNPKPTYDLVNSPSPRTLENLSLSISAGAFEEDDSVAQEDFTGTVGAATASDFMTFAKLWGTMPDISTVLTSPDRAPIPDALDVKFATATALGARATKTTIGPIGKYAIRLAQAGAGEVAAFLVRTSEKTEPEIRKTAAYKNLVQTAELQPLLG